MNEETQEVDEFEAELQRLQEQIVQEHFPKADSTPAPAAETPEEPADVTQAPAALSDDDLIDPALGVFGRMDDSKRREILQKTYGYDLTPKAELAKAGEQAVEQARQQITAQQMLEQKFQTLEDKNILPSDFEDLDFASQMSILNAAHADQSAAKKAQEIVAPLMQEREQAQYAQMIDTTANEWSTQLGRPDAAPKVKEFISQFGPQHVQIYMQEAQEGGGPFSMMVANTVKQIVEGMPSLEPETPLPKAEPIGGKETYNDNLSDAKRSFADKIAADPDFAGTDVAERFRQLA